MAVHLSWSAHERRKWLTRRGAQKGCFIMITTIHNIPRHIHRRGRQIVRLLQGVKTGKIVQKTVCVCRKSSNHSQHHSPISQFRLIVQKSHGPDCPVADARVLCRHMSSRGACNASALGSRGKTLKVFTVQHPICTNSDGGNW